MKHIKRFLNFLISLDEPHFANSASAMEMDAANESWVMLAPYGDWPNVQGLQRFKKEDADNIVNEFSSLASLPQRVLGLPWYVGHPDHPSFKDTYKDGSAKGRIKKLEARADGLWANVKWNADGKKLITDEAFHGHSVNWRMKQKGGAWSPFSLKSVGFTNEPQIPVPTILSANEAASEGKEEDVVMLPEFANGTREGVIKSWETRSRAGEGGKEVEESGDTEKADVVVNRRKAGTASRLAEEKSESLRNSSGETADDARHHVEAMKLHIDANEAQSVAAGKSDGSAEYRRHINRAGYHAEMAVRHSEKADKLKRGSSEAPPARLAANGSREGVIKSWETRRGAGDDQKLEASKARDKAERYEVIRKSVSDPKWRGHKNRKDAIRAESFNFGYAAVHEVLGIKSPLPKQFHTKNYVPELHRERSDEFSEWAHRSMQGESAASRLTAARARNKKAFHASGKITEGKRMTKDEDEATRAAAEARHARERRTWRTVTGSK